MSACTYHGGKWWCWHSLFHRQYQPSTSAMNSLDECISTCIRFPTIYFDWTIALWSSLPSSLPSQIMYTVGKCIHAIHFSSPAPASVFSLDPMLAVGVVFELSRHYQSLEQSEYNSAASALSSISEERKTWCIS